MPPRGDGRRHEAPTAASLVSICTTDILPVDLNALLYRLERQISTLAKKGRRRDAPALRGALCRHPGADVAWGNRRLAQEIFVFRAATIPRASAYGHKAPFATRAKSCLGAPAKGGFPATGLNLSLARPGHHLTFVGPLRPSAEG